jgi:hypothetical protein
MTENTKIPTAQNTIQDPPEYNAESVKNPREDYGQTKGGSDWLGGPQNGNETPSTAEKTLQEKPSSDISGPTGSGKIEGDYQSASHSTGYTDQMGSADWLGGPQNGSETPGHEKKAPKGSLSGGTGLEKPSSSSEQTTGGSESTEGAYQQNGQSWLGGPQNGNEIPGNGGNGGNGGNASGSGNAGNGEKTEGAYQTAAHSTGSEHPKQK